MVPETVCTAWLLRIDTSEHLVIHLRNDVRFPEITARTVGHPMREHSTWKPLHRKVGSDRGKALGSGNVSYVNRFVAKVRLRAWEG